MHLEMLPLPFLLHVRNTAWFHSMAGSSCSLKTNKPGMKFRVECHSRKRSGLMGIFRTWYEFLSVSNKWIKNEKAKIKV